MLTIIGGGGTGKSFLIKAVATAIRQKFGEAEGSTVLIIAPTGVAARNVKGETFHGGLSLGVENKGVPKYLKLGAQKLQILRTKYRKLKFIIETFGGKRAAQIYRFWVGNQHHNNSL